MEDSDHVAVAKVRAGNEDAYRTLVDRHSRTVFRLAYRMTGNEQDSEDVVQETFMRAYRQLHRWEARSSFSTWLYRIAANYSLDRYGGPNGMGGEPWQNRQTTRTRPKRYTPSRPTPPARNGCCSADAS